MPRYRRHHAIYLLLALLAIYAVAIEPRWLAERRLEILTPRWPLAEITLAVAADLHVGAPNAGLDMLDRVVAGINAARPDLILLPGDFVIHGVAGGTPVDPETIAAHLAKLSAPLGVFASLGNHDWWLDGPRVRKALEGAGIRVLDNESVALNHKGGRFALIGVGDDMTGHVDIPRATRGLPRELPSLVIVHDPANIPELPPGPALALAGHTHGGQVALPWFGALITPGRAPRQHAYGWIAGPVPGFVTAGVGTSILPVRFYRRPEYLIVRLATRKVDQPVAVRRL